MGGDDYTCLPASRPHLGKSAPIRSDGVTDICSCSLPAGLGGVCSLHFADEIVQIRGHDSRTLQTDKRPQTVECEKTRPRNGAGFRPFPPPQHWTKRCTGEPNTLRNDGVYIAPPYTISRWLSGRLLGQNFDLRYPEAYKASHRQQYWFIDGRRMDFALEGVRWCKPRQNSRYVYGWLSRPYAEARTFCRAPDIGPVGANAGTLTGSKMARAYSRGNKTHE